MTILAGKTDPGAGDDDISETVSFVYHWHVQIPPEIETRPQLSTTFATNYRTGSIEWHASLRMPGVLGLPFSNRTSRTTSVSGISIETTRGIRCVEPVENTCTFSYVVYGDSEGRIERTLPQAMHNSAAKRFMNDGIKFSSLGLPAFNKPIVTAIERRTGSLIVVSICLRLSKRLFTHAFERAINTSRLIAAEVPPGYEEREDFRFDYLTKGNLTLICDDGEIRADKRTLYLESGYFYDLSETLTSSSSFPLPGHKIDVVHPVVLYLHSLCFSLPTDTSPDFVRRLLTFVNLMAPSKKTELLQSIHRALCRLLLLHSNDFDFVIELAAIGSTYRFDELKRMACAAVANDFYELYKSRFPAAPLAMEPGNPFPRLMDEIFHITHSVFHVGQSPNDIIDKIRRSGSKTLTIV